MFTGEYDYNNLPETKNILPWWNFNVDLWSNQRDFNEVAEICFRFPHKLIDLRPYMIEELYMVHTTDKLP